MERLPATIKTFSLAMAAALARQVPNERGSHRRRGEDGRSQAGDGDAFGAGSVALQGKGTLRADSSPRLRACCLYFSFFYNDGTFTKGVFFGRPGWDLRDAHALATARGGCDSRSLIVGFCGLNGIEEDGFQVMVLQTGSSYWTPNHHHCHPLVLNIPIITPLILIHSYD